jgi:hypothetical protein
MTERPFSKRLQIVTLWMKGRLGERETVAWATKALQPPVSEETVALLDHLSSQAAREVDLHPDTKATWHRLHLAAQDWSTVSPGLHAGGFKQAIRNDEFANDDVWRLVDFVRPRLKAVGPNSLSRDAKEVDDNPGQWVIWDLEAACGSFDHGAATIIPELPRLSVGLLSRLIRQGTDALEEGLALARQVGWIAEERDLANSLVSRVAHDAPPDAARRDERDPDGFNDSFAPLVRLLTAAFDALEDKDSSAANRIVTLWQDQQAALFLRIRAYACSKASVCDGGNVARFLESLPAPIFWQWGRSPETASLRAVRWRDIREPERARLVKRLLTGPDADIFRSDSDRPEEAALYSRDHELARIQDNNEDVPEAIRCLVTERRDRDPQFPAHVPAVAPGRPPPRTRSIPEGDAAIFIGISEDDLIKALVESVRNLRIGDADNAKAYARRNQATLVGLLERRADTGEDVEMVWRLLLAHPEDKPEDVEAARLVAERIAVLALQVDPDLLDRLADCLCYWLYATGNNLGHFSGAVALWQRLIPLAADKANAAATAHEVDLSRDALNAPLGHLISFFLESCPEMPANGERPSLPEPFVSTLKGLEGHGRPIMANRMVTALNYFWRADKAWVESLVLGPMTSQPKEAAGLWEAFGKYTNELPDPDLWARLEKPLLLHIAAGRLSKEALGLLAQIAVAAWARSKGLPSTASVNAPALRSALAIAPEDVRTAAAWGFTLFFDRRQKEAEPNSSSDQVWTRLGKAFFDEVWPIEPAAQSGESAKIFARLPIRVAPQHFPNVVRTVLPYLRPFEIWAVELEFGLDDSSVYLVRNYPVETLALISACLIEDQGHAIYHLGGMLSQISDARPELEQDPRMRRLQRLVADDNR